MIVATTSLSIPKEIHVESSAIHEGQKNGRRGSVQVYSRPTVASRRRSLEQKVTEKPAVRKRTYGRRTQNRTRHYEGKTHSHVARADNKELETHYVTKAAVKIQSWGRRYLVKMYRFKMQISSTTIQKYVRRYLVEVEQALCSAHEGRLSTLASLNDRIHLSHIRDRSNRNVLHMCCNIQSISSNSFRQRFVCIKWIKTHHPATLSDKDTSGCTGSDALKIFAACVLQTAWRSLRAQIEVTFDSARKGKIGALKVFLKISKRKKLFVDAHGSSLMHVAATCKLRRDGASCIKYLSKVYKTIHKSIDRDGRLPLHIAAYFCSASNTTCDEVVQSILGVSDEITLFQKDKHDKDPAGIICQTGDLATVVHLLESIPQFMILSSKKKN